MVLYIVEECEMPCFSLVVTEGQMSIRTAEVRPYYIFFCFGRGMSVARCNQGGGLALPESCQGFCRSRYDAKKTEIGDENSASLKNYLDASRMYDWNWYINLILFVLLCFECSFLCVFHILTLFALPNIPPQNGE